MLFCILDVFHKLKIHILLLVLSVFISFFFCFFVCFIVSTPVAPCAESGAFWDSVFFLPRPRRARSGFTDSRSVSQWVFCAGVGTRGQKVQAGIGVNDLTWLPLGLCELCISHAGGLLPTCGH